MTVSQVFAYCDKMFPVWRIDESPGIAVIYHTKKELSLSELSVMNLDRAVCMDFLFRPMPFWMRAAIACGLMRNRYLKWVPK